MKIIACTLILAVFAVEAEELTIADNGTSAYQILIPENSGNAFLDNFVELGAQVVRTAIRKASGAEIPILKESRRMPDRPAICVGNTRELARTGLSSEEFAPWEHAVAVKGKDIFLYGKDLKNPLKKVTYPGWFVYYTLGSLKSACVFAEKFLNTRFVGRAHNHYGEHEGVRTLPQKKLTVPENYSYRKKPRFLHMDGDKGGLLFCVANNYYFENTSPLIVHNTSRAIPLKKYYSVHPEYFALLNGKRSSQSYPDSQYCLSNPHVRELIYQDALRQADNGSRIVEFGQSDGFKGCECPPCQAMYGTRDWSEKLWRMNSEFAARLKKDRPRVTPAIACYEITHQVPQSIRKFPVPVIINLAPVTPALLEGWKKRDIAGMTAWTYSSGCYYACGFSPGPGFQTLRRHARELEATPVMALFNCGLMDCRALGTPWIYMWGRYLGNRNLNWEQELSEFCRFRYGDKTGAVMEKFYRLLNSRLEKFPLPDPSKFQNYFEFREARNRSSAIEFWQQRYPEKIINDLTRLMEEASKQIPPDDLEWRIVRQEFEYLRLSAAVCNLYGALRKNTGESEAEKLVGALEARRRFIESLPEKNGLLSEAFYGVSRKMLMDGGYMLGCFGGVFDMPPQILLKKRRNAEIQEAPDFSASQWARIPVHTLLPIKTKFAPITAEFQVAANRNGVLFRFRTPLRAPLRMHPIKRDDTMLWQNAVWEILLTSGNGIRHFAFSALPEEKFDQVHYRTTQDPSWNPTWTHLSIVKDGIWQAEVEIPFATLGKTPKLGDRIFLQIGFSTPEPKGFYAWNVPQSGAFADISAFGELRFGKRTLPRKILLNENFSKKDAAGFPEGWYTHTYGRKCKVNILSGKDGEGIRLSSQQPGATTGLFRRSLEPLEADEEAVVTLVMRGTGQCGLNFGWHDGNNGFLLNEPKKSFRLTPESREYLFRYTPGTQLFRGAANFRLFLSFPHPFDAVVESVRLELRKKQ